MANRALLRAACLIGALSCLAGAAWLAFDWADSGPDGTCGNFIRYKGAGGRCADIIRHRILGVAGCLMVTIALLIVVWVTRPGRDLRSS